MRVVGVFVLGPKAVAKGACAAARGQEGCWRVENRVSDTETACLDGGLCSVMRTWMIPPRQFFERGLYPSSTKGGGCLESSCVRDLHRRASCTTVSEGDWGNRLKFPPGYVLCSRKRVTVPHLRGKLFGEGGQRIIQQGGAGFGEFGLLSPRSCLGRHVVENHTLRREGPWRGLWFGSRFLLTSFVISATGSQGSFKRGTLTVGFASPLTTEDGFREAY